MKLIPMMQRMLCNLDVGDVDDVNLNMRKRYRRDVRDADDLHDVDGT